MTHKERAEKFIKLLNNNDLNTDSFLKCLIAQFKSVAEEARRQAFDEAIPIVENGIFIHDEAYDSIFGKGSSKAIRSRIKGK